MYNFCLSFVIDIDDSDFCCNRNSIVNIHTRMHIEFRTTFFRCTQLTNEKKSFLVIIFFQRKASKNRWHKVFFLQERSTELKYHQMQYTVANCFFILHAFFMASIELSPVMLAVCCWFDTYICIKSGCIAVVCQSIAHLL